MRVECINSDGDGLVSLGAGWSPQSSLLSVPAGRERRSDDYRGRGRGNGGRRRAVFRAHLVISHH